ncbi:MAG: hypothetical protein ACKVOK_14910 [Flavobacteriales bacterium]
MKFLCTVLLFSHVLMSWTQVVHTQEGKLTLPLQNYKRQMVEGATVKINGRSLKPQTECAIPEYCRGVYVLDSFPYVYNNFRKVWIEINHPDYEPIVDSIYLYYNFYLAPKGVSHHFYSINKMPFTERGLVTEVSNIAKEELKIGRKDIIIDSSVTCRSLKFDPSEKADSWYVKHPNERAMKSFLRKNNRSAIALDFQNAGGHPSGMPLSRIFNINNISSDEKYVEIENFLKSWDKQGVIEKYIKVPSPAVVQRFFEVHFTPDGFLDFEKHLDELEAKFGVQISQEFARWPCPG